MDWRAPDHGGPEGARGQGKVVSVHFTRDAIFTEK